MSQAYNGKRKTAHLYAPIYILPDYDKYEENKQCHVVGGKEQTTLEVCEQIYEEVFELESEGQDEVVT